MNKLYILIVFIYCISFVINQCTHQDPPITLGVWTVNGTQVRIDNPNVTIVPFEDEHNALTQGLQFWAAQQNNIGGISLNDHHCAQVILKFFNLGLIPELTFPALQVIVTKVVNVFNDPTNNNIPAFFAPFTTSLTNITAYYTNLNNRVLISNSASDPSILQCPTSNMQNFPPCTVPGSLRFNNVFGVIPFFNNSGAQIATALFNEINPLVTSPLKIAYIVPIDSFSMGISLVARQTSESLGASTILYHQLNYSTDINDAKIDEIINIISNLSPAADYVSLHGLSNFCGPMMDGLVRNQYRPKALVMTCQNSNFGPNNQYLLSSTFFSCVQNGFDSEFNVNVAQFCTSLSTSPSITLSALGYLAGKVLTAGIESARTGSVADVDKIVKKLEKVNHTNLYGTTYFDSVHQSNTRQIIMSQSDANAVWKVILPLNIAQATLVYPMPAFPSPIQEGAQNIPNNNDQNSGVNMIFSILALFILYLIF